MAPKIILDNAQVQELVAKNKYKLTDTNRNTARCIDGRYENSEELGALAIPGGDLGELAALYATANEFGFEVDYDKALISLQSVTGKNNFCWHTDTHGEKDVLASGCGHMKQMRLDPKAYNLEPDQIEVLNKQVEKAFKDGGKQTELQGDHQEGAVLIIRGEYSVMPQYYLQTDHGKVKVQVFEFHHSLVSERLKTWAKKLVEDGAVKLLDHLDDEYLYQVLSEKMDDHLFETSKRLAKTLPIFRVHFQDDGSAEIEEMGFV
jgi:hypothetical protein